MRPFLRWAGGKRWLTQSGHMAIPATHRYVEPFLGGGAVFFSKTPEKALLADLNPYLINAYSVMRDDPRRLYQHLIEHFDAHCPEHYYNTRSRGMSLTTVGAADFIYLNRACFNGLFRVNLSGQFNVPIGTKLFELRSESELLSWSNALQKARIEHSDFERVIDSCGAGDFMFLDPPYTVNHNSNGFIEYNEKIFSWDDQVRLVSALKRARGRGAQFILTNADHDAVRDLYADFSSMSAGRGSEMAGKSAHRRATTELLVASSAKMLLEPKLI